MCHPRYCLAHHPGTSSNITNATHFRTPPTPANQPPYPRWHTSHVIYVGTSPTQARHSRHPRQNDTNGSTNSTPFLKLSTVVSRRIIVTLLASQGYVELLYYIIWVLFSFFTNVFFTQKLTCDPMLFSLNKNFYDPPHCGQHTVGDMRGVPAYSDIKILSTYHFNQTKEQ